MEKKTQDDFRSLLSAVSSTSTSTVNPYVSQGNGKSKKSKPAKTSKGTGDGDSGGGSGNVFKPRKVREGKGGIEKGKEKGYRDRAEERRRGGDDAEWESVREVERSFKERIQASDATERAILEKQRQYLGGDAEHSVLVKGLDFALLERSKALLKNDDKEIDESLEDAFKAPPPPPERFNQKTKIEMIQELKAKRAEEEKNVVERAKAQGLFKAVGVKEEPVKKKKKKRKEGEGEGEEERKKKKRKVDESVQPQLEQSQMVVRVQEPILPEPKVSTKASINLEGFEDGDIFADAGEWKPDSTSEDEDADGVASGVQINEKSPTEAQQQIPPRKYFEDDSEEEQVQNDTKDVQLPSWLISKRKQSGSTTIEEKKDVEDEPFNPYSASSSSHIPTMRLEGLSSSIPSIKDLLAMDEVAEKEEKRKARKDKFKGKKSKEKKDLTDDQKVHRDLQQFEAYERKQQIAESRDKD